MNTQDWEKDPRWLVLLDRITGVETMAQIHGTHPYHGETIQSFITSLIQQARVEELEWVKRDHPQDWEIDRAIDGAREETMKEHLLFTIGIVCVGLIFWVVAGWVFAVFIW